MHRLLRRQTFESQQAGLKLNSEFHRQPLERIEKEKTRRHERFPGHNPGQTILNAVKSSDVLFLETTDKRDAVVELPSSKSCCQ